MSTPEINDAMTIDAYFDALTVAHNTASAASKRLSLSGLAISYLYSLMLDAFKAPEIDSDRNFLDALPMTIEGLKDVPRTKSALAELWVEAVFQTYTDFYTKDPKLNAQQRDGSFTPARVYEFEMEREACLEFMLEVSQAVLKSLGHSYYAKYSAQLPAIQGQGRWELP